ncbi:MAG: peptide deformylase [Oligoflexia bacterium]|nr:peptide deformylase [Oligoflexia bacterium]
MSILKVARMGHPVLREVARELKPSEIRSDAIRRLVEDMLETMHEYSGVGLAAPQVHQSIQLAVIEFEDDNPRYPDAGAQGLTVFFNPRITVLDTKEQGFWEGCLSVPEMRGLVHRPRKVKVDYLDVDARPQTLIAEDFLATVVQHELDHLQGVLYVDRIKDLRKFAFLEEYKRYWIPEEEDEVGELDD